MIWLKSRRRRKSSPIAGRGTRWRFKALSSPSRDTPRPYPAPCARRRPAGQTVSAGYSAIDVGRVSLGEIPLRAHNSFTSACVSSPLSNRPCRYVPNTFLQTQPSGVPSARRQNGSPFTVVRPLWISYPVIRAPANGAPSATARCFSPCRSSSVRCCARSGRLHNPYQ